MAAQAIDGLRLDAEMVVMTGTDKDWFDTIDAGALRLARHYLESHPPDDAEPATAEAVLRAFPQSKQYLKTRSVIMPVGEFSLKLYESGEWNFAGCEIWPGRTVTLGDVRRLVQALEGGG